MSNKEAIEIIKTAIAEVEWECPMNYSVAFDMAIEALESQDRQAIIAGSYLLEGKDTNVPSKGTVSRQQVLDALDRFSLGETDVAKLTFRLRDYLMRLPSAELEQRWIPCSERLPAVEYDYLGNWYSAQVLLLMNNEEVIDVCNGHFNPIGVFEKPEADYDVFVGKPVKDVLAWMPMPELYEGEQDE